MEPTVLGCLDPDGRYPLIRKIGWGKWATMYTAIDTVTKEEVVVKCMKLYDIDVAARDHLLTYLQREVDNHRCENMSSSSSTNSSRQQQQQVHQVQQHQQHQQQKRNSADCLSLQHHIDSYVQHSQPAEPLC